MREDELLAHIYARSAALAKEHPHIQVGPGDDCAVISAPSPLLLKVDQLVSGVHFRPDTPPDLIARKAIARAVSDIAAMGGSPSCALAGAALPASFPEPDLLFDRMAHWARHWGCPLVGGDIASAPVLALSVTIVGTPHPQRGPVLRSGAMPGDTLYVTGPLGASLDPATGRGPHLEFEPRLAEARALCDALGPRLRAMMDISDGLGVDAARLAAASRVRIEIDAARVPLRPAAADWLSAAADGEDYELLFTAPEVPGAPVPVHPIGRVLSGQGCVFLTPEGPVDASRFGWVHGA